MNESVGILDSLLARGFRSSLGQRQVGPVILGAQGPSARGPLVLARDSWLRIGVAVKSTFISAVHVIFIVFCFSFTITESLRGAFDVLELDFFSCWGVHI